VKTILVTSSSITTITVGISENYSKKLIQWCSKNNDDKSTPERPKYRSYDGTSTTTTTNNNAGKKKVVGTFDKSLQMEDQ